MAADALLIIPNIQGESADQTYPGAIEVLSYDFGVNQETSMQTGSGLVAGGASFDPFTIRKKLDKSSIKLFQHCATGAMIDNAKLVLRRPGEKGASPTQNAPVEYLIFEFTNLLVTHFTCDGSSGSAIPDETIDFAIQGYRKSYRQIVEGSAQGAITKGYDLKKNVKV